MILLIYNSRPVRKVTWHTWSKQICQAACSTHTRTHTHAQHARMHMYTSTHARMHIHTAYKHTNSTRTRTNTLHSLTQTFQDKGSAGHRIHTHHTHARAYTQCTHADAVVSRQRQDRDNSPAVDTLSQLRPYGLYRLHFFAKHFLFFKYYPSP